MHARPRLPLAIAVLVLVPAPLPAAAADPVAEKAGQADALVAGERARADAVPDFATMRAPSSPAFVLLGVSPSQVERPATPADVVASVGSVLARGSDGIVPDGVALEIAPYWLLPSWGLGWDDYEREWWAAFYRSFSLSVASVSDPDPPSTADGSLAVGARTSLVRGRPRNDCTRAVAAFRELGRELTAALVVPDDVERGFRERLGFGSQPYLEAVARWQAEARAPFDRRMPKVHEACDAAGRVGLAVDVAGAFSWRFPASSAREGHREAGAAWITAAWAADGWSLVAMARFDARSLSATPDRSLDAGLRAIVQQERYAASFEGVVRRTYDGETGTKARLALAADYRIAGDTWISIAFGRDELVSDVGSLFTSANLRWAFGQKGFE